MARHSPLLPLHENAEALLDIYGPPEAEVAVVQTYGSVELEYGAIRKGCGLLDQPHRGTLVVTGADRIEFLGRMLTQEMKEFVPGAVRNSFWLSRKGRIDADVRILNLSDRLLIDTDVHAAARAAETLGAYIITEEVFIQDITESMHRLALHGPAAPALLDAMGAAAAVRLQPSRSAVAIVAGAEVVIDRFDSTGEPGFELWVPTGAAVAVYTAILQHGSHPAPGAPRLRFRPIGWAAWNIARIEAGTPLYNLDFGVNSLPAETGVLEDRVSFTKGCYLGQEIVARMKSLGHPKQRLVALRVTDPNARNSIAAPDPTLDAPPAPEVRQPVTGNSVLEPGGSEPIGAVTSSAISPMLGNQPVCFAMLKYKHSTAGTALRVEAGGAALPCVVQPTLRFLPN